ncbi:MAG: polysaccharide pyruvyl transferase family protein [Roseicyclus sp.]
MGHETTGTRRSYAVFAAPLSGNKGSASMVWGLRDLLLSEGVDAELVVFSYYPDHDRRIAEAYPDITVRKGHPVHLASLLVRQVAARVLPFLANDEIRDLARVEAAFLVGGTTFADSKLFKAPWNVIAMLPAWFAGRPVHFLSQTMGPFRKPLNRRLACFALSRADQIHGRGETSAANVRGLGFDHAVYCPDLSFGMDLDAVPDQAALDGYLAQMDAAAKDAPKGLAGVTPNTIVLAAMEKTGVAYPALLAAVIEDLSARGYHPVLIPHSFRGVDKGKHNNDANLCRDILKLLPAGLATTFVDADLSSQALRVLVGRLDLLVASRFHSMISALDRGVPPVTLGWGDQKYVEVLREFEAEDLYIDFSEASFAAIRDRIDHVETHRADIEARLARGIVRARRGLRQHLTALTGR